MCMSQDWLPQNMVSSEGFIMFSIQACHYAEADAVQGLVLGIMLS